MAGELEARLPAGGRFTAYLPAERRLLMELASVEGSSENYLLRIGARALLGLPIPRHYRELIAGNLDGPCQETSPPAKAKVAA